MASFGKFFALLKIPVPFNLVTLRGLPFGKWPDEIGEPPWIWLGMVRPAYHDGRTWQRAKPEPDPMPRFWAFFTRDDSSYDLKYAYKGEHDQFADVNPKHYRINAIIEQEQTKVPPVEGIIDLMASSGYWPTTVEELLARWPEFAGCSREELEETLKC